MGVTNKNQALASLQADRPELYRAAKKVARNTWDYVGADGLRRIRLHNTDIVEFLPRGRVRLNTGGWRSLTTKDRMGTHSGFDVWSKRGQWIVMDRYQGEDVPRRSVPFYDGIVLPDAFAASAKKAEREAARVAKVRKQIKAFCDYAATLDSYPLPNDGDCLICWMQAEPPATNHNGGFETPGQTGPGGDTHHLMEHMREKYVHGMLLVNALRWAGYPETGLGFHLRFKPKRGDTVTRSLRRYLQRKLGVG